MRSRETHSPVLCTPGNVLLLLLASTGVSLCLTLASMSPGTDFWPRFGLHAVFIFSVVLATSALICERKGGLVRRLPLPGLWAGFVVLQLMVLFGSLLVIVFEPWLRPLALVAHDAPLFFLGQNLAISLVVSLVLVRYVELQQRWREQVTAESRARLDSLQSRIRPHFLFNALNTISSLIPDKPDQAEQATMDLSDLLRTGLKEGTHHALSDELELVRGYLRIESLRLGDRLEVEWDLAEDLPLDYELPVLLIQPLVENAVIHGIARLPEGGKLHITGDRPRRKRLRFVIENPVPGPDEKPAEGNRMALDNIRQRLELAWEEGARLKTYNEDGRFRVELVIPLA